MKMTVCDRCGKPVNVVKIDPEKTEKTFGDLVNEAMCSLAKALSRKNEADLPRVMLGEEEIDLCEECRKDLQGWVKVKPFDFDLWLRKEEQPDGTK